MSKLSDMFDSAKGLVGSIGDSIDKNVTSEEERVKIKGEFAKIATDYQVQMAQKKAELIKSEMNGNKLQRSWRPILFLSFGAIVIYEYFFSPIFNFPTANLPTDFWDLLSVGIGGGVIGRSAEKISTAISENLPNVGKRR
jgi:hypothetical protein